MAPVPNRVADVEERIDVGVRGLFRLAATCPENRVVRQSRQTFLRTTQVGRPACRIASPGSPAYI
jgi:hypothetical protein